MLAAVLLHHAQAARAVHMALNLHAGLQRSVRPMPYLAVRVMHVQHAHAAKRAMIGPLAAALWKKSRAVKRDPISPIRLPAGAHRGRKVKQPRILIV